jgi:hypothetical protein
LIVLRWKFVSSSRSFLGKCTVSSPYKSLGMTYAWSMLYDVLGLSPMVPCTPDFIKE